MAKKKRKATKQTAESPTSSCLIFCEDVVHSLRDNLHTLTGIITEMFMPELPAMTGAGMVYMRLSNVYANQQISIRFTNMETSQMLFRFAARSPKESDPLGNHLIIIRIPPFEMPRAGRYVFSAVHDEVPFAECVITVKTLENRDYQ